MSAGRGSISLTSTAIRLPLTTTAPLATGMLLARIRTSSSSEASSSMMAPRPSRSTWWIGMVVVPSTTAISSETLSSVAKGSPRALAGAIACGIVSPRHGYEVVNARNDLPVGLVPAAGAPPVEWRVSDGLVDYDSGARRHGGARRRHRGAAKRAELVWLLEHPPLYTAGTQRAPHDLIDARFPVHAAGRGGQFTYHGPGQRVGYVMLDLKRRAPDVRRFVATSRNGSSARWRPSTCAASGARIASASGCGGPTRAPAPRTRSPPSAFACSHWVTLHGIALNVAPDLTHFAGIVPCGVAEPRYGVTCSPISACRRRCRRSTVLRAEFEPLFGATAGAQILPSTENSSPGRRSAKSSNRPRADRLQPRARRAARHGTARSS